MATLTTTPTTTPTGASAAVQTATSRGLADIRGDDFVNLLVKQLQFQDPFKPISNEEMVSQLSTIRELETNTRLGQRLEQLGDQQRFGSAAALIGRFVSGTVTDDAGQESQISGVVKGVRFNSNGEAVLELDNGQVLPLANLEEVSDVSSVTA